MSTLLRSLSFIVGVPLAVHAQNAGPYLPATLPTGNLLSESGPTFLVDAGSSPVTLIGFGDQRFTDPTNTKVTNPRVRLWMVDQIAAARPTAVVLNGDVPYSGAVKNDYEVFQAETKP